MHIKTRSWISWQGREYPPGSVLEMSDREALGIIGQQQADELSDDDLRLESKRERRRLEREEPAQPQIREQHFPPAERREQPQRRRERREREEEDNHMTPTRSEGGERREERREGREDRREGRRHERRERDKCEDTNELLTQLAETLETAIDIIADTHCLCDDDDRRRGRDR
jgi:hypothetical protein